jgi:4-amino-4-deoxy-L-arabinose transferase-like glycosyltransferase
MRPHGPYFWLAIILLAALALRVAAAVVWQQRLPNAAAFAFPDSESYWELGRQLARGDTYEFSGSRAFRTPGYPLLLAPLFWAFRNQPPVLAARLVGAVLGTVAVGGIAWLARMLFNERAMLIAALAGALYLEAIAMSILVLSEALFCPLMIGQLLLWTCAWRARERRSMWALAISAGVFAGLAVLTRPSWLLFTPLAIGVSLCFTRRPYVSKPAIAASAVILLALVATMSPWWIRNYAVLHAFVPTSTETGASLYDGWHAEATGASDMRFAPRPAFQFKAPPNDTTAPEVVFDRYLTRKALDWARKNPLRVGELAWIKLVRMWNIWPNEASLRSWPLRLAVAAGFVPLLVLGIVGAFRFARQDFPYALCLLPAVYFSLLHMIFVGSIRYRQPAMLVLIVLAAGAADWIWNKASTPRGRG